MAAKLNMLSTALIVDNSKLEETESLSWAIREYPLVVKYMGSKAKILDFIQSGIIEIDDFDLPIVDLFSGAGSISGGFGDKFRIISNDIQSYSEAIASCYLKKAKLIGSFDILNLAAPLVEKKMKELPAGLNYPASCTLEKFNKIDNANRSLININFDWSYHLFTKNYSGTWWSSEQCVWIDTIREVLDQLLKSRKIDKNDFMLGIVSLMHAMAYSSQGTGHYAQYRDATTEASMLDINIYRQKNVAILFERKLKSLSDWNKKNVVNLGHETLSLDYRECLKAIPKSIVYADPPYAFVHYSRFYHALETIYKYDYPEIQRKAGQVVKGRYRENRHQSPFCIKTQVKDAFISMFEGIKETQSHMILSYSDAGMISFEDLLLLAKTTFDKNYTVKVKTVNYQHKTMGRKADHSRDVQEVLIIAMSKI